ncbi:hypothetical protein FQ087_13165 [Sporosarcina sp. ANT_H38]|uniref:hypothetical protein n=1 Tax=Sporosarcina sp. ANT_H38 TaxID=2597358 RepID=UPI0011F25393|nr:hypothetical protein [Sporosarcina sp. ANT_H38]KAA0955554.1 hypothetical protein FQ087_13165 [Sporosarcina sp. ANT_H38]
MKKVLGVFLVFAFLLGAGTIYASMNPGQNLSAWYKDALLEESKKVGAATATGIIVVLKDVNAFLEESKQSIDDALASFSDDKVRETEADIEEYKANTINSLNKTVAELESLNFDDFVDKQNIEEVIDLEFEKMVEEVLSE